ncbi:hypothetical protein NQ317_002173 [Molorchus minor]|uniref:THUMP domain-containing protein n=1 Tax=Molorchus minor TaxID=1323400 RepID=A0ABQ9IXK7_9CUCU|nr:hypothetical protein NQ317_002173 [Molorchus minor]
MSKIEKKKYKHKFYNTKPRKVLDVNLKGFLCSCNNREKDCIRESYNILNKYADILYPVKPMVPDTEGVDVQDELENELTNLKAEVKAKRFQVVESGAKNILFISTTLNDPLKLAEAIVCDIEKTKTQQTRFLLRLVPIEITCKAYIHDIVNAFKPLVDKYFKEEPKTFSIIYNHRNNNNLKKDEVIKKVADIVFEARWDHKVNLKEAKVSIVIEGTGCIFFQYTSLITGNT